MSNGLSRLLLAELSGKGRRDLENDEDMLTSTVFGILKYLPLSVFWETFLTRARSATDISFVDRCAESGVNLHAYADVTIHPWPVCEGLGEPDLVIILSGRGQSPVCFIIEAKLWSGKSGTGEEDQLVRYLRILENESWLSRVAGIRESCVRPGVIYLCARAAWADIRGSIEAAPNPRSAEQSLFLVQWQDVLDVARQAVQDAPHPYSLMLEDLAGFLSHRELSYFDGFSEPEIPESLESDVQFYAANMKPFSGFATVDLSVTLQHDAKFYGGRGLEGD